MRHALANACELPSYCDGSLRWEPGSGSGLGLALVIVRLYIQSRKCFDKRFTFVSGLGSLRGYGGWEPSTLCFFAASLPPISSASLFQEYRAPNNIRS